MHTGPLVGRVLKVWRENSIMKLTEARESVDLEFIISIYFTKMRIKKDWQNMDL
jgi:hypothetical protein